MLSIQPWIPLNKAIEQTTEALSISFDDAISRVLDACRNQEIKSQGAAPLNAHPDVGRAWERAAGCRIESLRREDWNLKQDFTQNTLGRYRFVELWTKDFLRWLKTSRKKPVSGRKPGRPAGSATDDTKSLAEIKAMIKKGDSKNKACHAIAKKYPGYSEKATLERLRKKLRVGKIK